MKLMLKPFYGYRNVECKMKEVAPNIAMIDDSFDASSIDKNQFIFSDICYSGFIELEELLSPTHVDFYLNGEKIECVSYFDEDKVRFDFSADRCLNGLIFRDCYGYVQFEIVCKWDSDENMLRFQSDYIGVMLRATKENESIQRMAEYVYRNHDKFLWKRNTSPFGLVDLTSHSSKTLEVQIELVRKVQEIYERILPYLKVNAHTKPEVLYRVDDFEKLRHVSSKVLGYIAQHPDELSGSDTETGIQYRNQKLYPKKTLIQSPERIVNTYENQVVIGFLRNVGETVDELILKIRNILRTESSSDQFRTPDGYILSTVYILESSYHSLRNKLEELQRLSISTSSLFWAYKQIFSFDCERLTTMPKPSAVFRSVVVYRQVYEMMSKWFEFGCYDFSGERFMLPLLVNNQLYEYYGLLFMASQLEKAGFHHVEKKDVYFEYSAPDPHYHDVGHNNTLCFEDADGTFITLYYQPVVWDGNTVAGKRNGISLVRATSLSRNEDGSLSDNRRGRTCFYTPDYILKYQKNGIERYIILDAKLSSRGTVIINQIEPIAFKYQFSIRSAADYAQYLGTILLYGKSTDRKCEIEDVHDMYVGNADPFFYIASYTESDACSPESKEEAFADILSLLRAGQDNSMMAFDIESRRYVKLHIVGQRCVTNHGGFAEGYYTDIHISKKPGVMAFVLCKGSTVSMDATPSCPDFIHDLRRKGVDVLTNGKLNRDVLFTSSTQASNFVYYGNTNGPDVWKYEIGLQRELE